MPPVRPLRALAVLVLLLPAPGCSNGDSAAPTAGGSGSAALPAPAAAGSGESVPSGAPSTPLPGPVPRGGDPAGVTPRGAWAGSREAPSSRAAPRSSADAAGSAPSAPTSGEAPSGTAGTAGATARPVVVRVRIDGGRVEPAPGRAEVPVGSLVRIVAAGDRPDDLHVHGYEVQAPLVPGEPAEVEFVADRPGLFDVEAHDAGLLLTRLAVG